jgi:competence protein ComEC
VDDSPFALPIPGNGGSRSRVWSLVAAFAAGLAAADAMHASASWPWWLLAGLFGLLAAALASTRCWFLPILAATLCLGGGWYVARLIEAPRARLEGLIGLDGAALIRVRGVALTAPARTPEPPGSLAKFAVRPASHRFDLRVEAVEAAGTWTPVSGLLWVHAAGAASPQIAAGSPVEMLGRFEPVSPPTNPGETDMRLLAADRGFSGSLRVSQASLITPIATESRSSWQRLSSWTMERHERLRRRAHDLLAAASGSDPAARSLVLGLMLGEYDPSQQAIYDAFARQNLVHILSISGFHLSVMAGLALMLVRLTGDRGWIEPLVVGLLVVLYASLVPAQSPIIRSAALTLALIAGELSSRRYDRLTLLGWVALGLLLWRPTDLWSLGCQLSVGLTACLLWLATPVKEAIFPPRLKGVVRSGSRRSLERFADGLKTSFAASLLCCVVSLPVLMGRAGVVSPLAIVVGLLLTPLVTLLLWIGFLALLAGSLLAGAEAWAAAILSPLAHASISLVTFADSLPGSSFRTPPVSWVWMLIATPTLMLVMRHGLSGAFPSRRRWISAGAVAGLSLWLAMEWSLAGSLPSSTVLRIDMLDVGDGTCHVVRSGEEALLWDCGTLSTAGSRATVVAAARSLGIASIPTAVVTHPDLDHFGALLDAAQPLGLRRVLVPERFLDDARAHPRGAAAITLAGLAARRIDVVRVKAGDRLKLGEATLEFLSPPSDASFDADNDHSLVGLFTGERFGPDPMLLLTGDVQDEAIASLEAAHPSLMPAAAELPHHGSARQVAVEWVCDHLKPLIVLQSTGVRRRDDPRWNRAREGRTWLCTARLGACWMRFEQGGRTLHGSFLTDVP